MARRERELSEDQVLNLAFEHVGQLARLLQAAGHADMAAMLNGMTDVGELWRRRLARGGTSPAHEESLDYVLTQMADLALLMDSRGLGDAAVLFRLPARFVAARRVGAGMDVGPRDCRDNANDIL